MNEFLFPLGYYLVFCAVVATGYTLFVIGVAKASSIFGDVFWWLVAILWVMAFVSNIGVTTECVPSRFIDC